MTRPASASGPWLAFGPAWFARHQRTLIWLLASPVLGRVARWALRIRPCDVGCRGRIVAVYPHAYVVDNGDGTETADIRTHWKFSKRVYRALAPVWWAMHAWDWACADRWAPRLSFGFSTLTEYPDPGTGATTVDGYVVRQSVSETWSTIRAAAGTNADQSSASANVVMMQGAATTNRYSAILRSIFTFNTAAVGAGVVTSAVFSLYGSGKSDNLGVSPNIDIYGATPASDNALVSADFAQVGSTSYTGTPITYSGWSSSAYNAFTLNSTGRAAIDVSGITPLGVRNANYDAANVAPTWSAAQSDISAYYADETGTSKDPKLVVTYRTSRWTVTVDGVEVEPRSNPPLAIQKASNGRATLDMHVVSLDGTYQPDLGSEVILDELGDIVFAGTLEHVTRAGLKGEGVTAETVRLSAIDYSGLADRRRLAGTRSSESTLARVTWIASELDGVTVHGSQATGVTLEAQTYDYSTAAQALTDIARANGPDWIWRIDSDKALRVLAAGTEAAPFDIAPDGYAVGDVTVDISRDNYRNSIIVRAGDGGTTTRTETFTAVGGDTSFTTAMPASGNIELAWPSLLIVDGVSQGPVFWETGGGWEWHPSTHTLSRVSGYSLSAGEVVTITYAATFPFTVTAPDAGEIAANGRADELIERRDIREVDAAQAVADAELAARLVPSTTVRYETREPGLEVGQLQHIEARGVDTDCLVREIAITGDVGSVRLRYRVTAEVGQVSESYRDTYQKWGQT
jgi:hypothetical protein